MHFLTLLRREDLAVKPRGPVPVGPPAQRDHPVLAHSQVEAAALVEADVEAALLQGPVQLHALLHDGPLVGRPEHAQHPGPVLGRPVGDVALVDDYHVLPPSLHQVVGHRVADEPGPRHHHAGLLGQPGLGRDVDDGVVGALNGGGGGAAGGEEAPAGVAEAGWEAGAQQHGDVEVVVVSLRWTTIQDCHSLAPQLVWYDFWLAAKVWALLALHFDVLAPTRDTQQHPDRRTEMLASAWNISSSTLLPPSDVNQCDQMNFFKIAREEP